MINNKTYLKICQIISKESYCNNKKVGCIIVKNGNIISMGYNGTPTGFDNKCEINGKTKKEVLHAESNAITKCAKSNYSTQGGSLYCTLSPCVECSKLIIQSGINKVYYIEEYKCKKGVELLNKCKVYVQQINV